MTLFDETGDLVENRALRRHSFNLKRLFSRVFGALGLASGVGDASYASGGVRVV